VREGLIFLPREKGRVKGRGKGKGEGKEREGKGKERFSSLGKGEGLIFLTRERNGKVN